MFDPVSLGAASIGVNRVSRVSSPARVSDLSSRSRKGEDAAFSHESAQRAAESRPSRDPVGNKDKAKESRHGQRHEVDATEEESPKPKVKFRSPSKDGGFEPIFVEEGNPSVRRSESSNDAQPAEALDGSGRSNVGTRLDVFA